MLQSLSEILFIQTSRLFFGRVLHLHHANRYSITVLNTLEHRACDNVPVVRDHQKKITQTI